MIRTAFDDNSFEILDMQQIAKRTLAINTAKYMILFQILLKDPPPFFLFFFGAPDFIFRFI